MAWRTHGVSISDRLRVLVLFQKPVQCLGSLPLIEYATNLGIRIGDLAGQRVCIEPVKGLLGTLIREIHQIRQGHNRIPGRIGNHLDGKVLFDGVGIAGPHQLLKVKLLVWAPRMGKGIDSVTKIRLERTGRYPSSPSEILPVPPTAL